MKAFPKFDVKMISRTADWDTTMRISAKNKTNAKELAPSFMGRPDAWLVVSVEPVRKPRLVKPNNDNSNDVPNEHATDTLKRVVEWLDVSESSLTYGLRCVEDGVKLFRYFQANEKLPEFADDDSQEYATDKGKLDYSTPIAYDGKTLAEHRVAALGYDPQA